MHNVINFGGVRTHSSPSNLNLAKVSMWSPSDDESRKEQNLTRVVSTFFETFESHAAPLLLLPTFYGDPPTSKINGNSDNLYEMMQV